MPTERFEVGSVDDFADDSLTPLKVGEHEIVLVKQGGAFYALPDRCTHAKYPLHDGELLDGALKCSYHGATFDLCTGRATLPAVKKIRLFEMQVEENKVYLLMEEA